LGRNLIVIASVIIVTFLLSFKNQHNSTYSSNTADTISVSLADYGKYLFMRDKCDKCHSFDQSEDKKIKSLDGLGELYTKEFIYTYLLNPAALEAGSKKKPNQYLPSGVINKNSFEKNIGNITEEQWNSIQDEARALSDTFKLLDIYLTPNSEALALMAYLINVPQSESLKAKRIAEQKKWDSAYSFAAETIRFEITKEGSKEKGSALFSAYCFICHGSNGEGIVGPNLTDSFWKHGGTNENIAETIINGVPEKAMPGWRRVLTPEEVGQLVAYIISIQGTNSQNEKTIEGVDH